jgi:hypothetical protein
MTTETKSVLPTTLAGACDVRGSELRSIDGFGVWVPVAEGLPKAGRRVLVTALNGIHVWRTVAQYWPAGTMDASNWDDPPEDWWDKDGDKCTNPEPGWYESQIETEVSYQLTGVSHWMALPPSPNNPVTDAEATP